MCCLCAAPNRQYNTNFTSGIQAGDGFVLNVIFFVCLTANDNRDYYGIRFDSPLNRESLFLFSILDDDADTDESVQMSVSVRIRSLSDVDH